MKVSAKEASLTAAFIAVYLAYTGASGVTVGFVTRGLDSLLVRSVVFVMLVAMVRRFGASTTAGLVSGAVLELVVPSPVRLYLLPSHFAYGLVYDIYMDIHRYLRVLSRRHVVIGTALASLAMAVIALSVFTLVGFFPPGLILVVWVGRTGADVILGILGALLGLVIASRVLRIKP